MARFLAAGANSPADTPWRTPWLDRLPGCCAICRAWPARTVCEDCAARFAPPTHRCRRCALALPGGPDTCGTCLRHPPPLDACVVCCGYDWPWPDPIGRFKFQGEPGLAAPLAALMRRAPAALALLQAADHVLPMPLAPARLRQRGFNQSLELARRLAPPAKLAPRLLLRLRETAPQSGLARAGRIANLRGAFGVPPAQAPRLAGRHVLLVDDVMTSGASLHSAALVLRGAGASQVSALVFARTPPPEPA